MVPAACGCRAEAGLAHAAFPFECDEWPEFVKLKWKDFMLAGEPRRKNDTQEQEIDVVVSILLEHLLVLPCSSLSSNICSSPVCCHRTSGHPMFNVGKLVCTVQYSRKPRRTST